MWCGINRLCIGVPNIKTSEIAKAYHDSQPELTLYGRLYAMCPVRHMSSSYLNMKDHSIGQLINGAFRYRYHYSVKSRHFHTWSYVVQGTLHNIAHMLCDGIKPTPSKKKGINPNFRSCWQNLSWWKEKWMIKRSNWIYIVKSKNQN